MPITSQNNASSTEIATETLVDRLNKNIRALATPNWDATTLEGLHKDTITLQETAQLIGLTGLVDIARTMETSLEPLRKKKRLPTPQLIDALLRCQDLIGKILKSVHPTEGFYQKDLEAAIPRLIEASLHSMGMDITMRKEFIASEENFDIPLEAPKPDPTPPAQTPFIRSIGNTTNWATVQVPVTLLNELSAILNEITSLRTQVFGPNTAIRLQETQAVAPVYHPTPNPVSIQEVIMNNESVKLFGEFLVERQVVTEEQLLTALMEQLVLMPSICEVIYKERLLGSTELLKVLSYQSKHKCEFQKACQELGYWTVEMEERCHQAIQAIKIPIGQILVRQGCVTFQSITKALDEYLATLPDSPNTASPEIPALSPEPPPAIEIPIPAPVSLNLALGTTPETVPAVAALPTLDIGIPTEDHSVPLDLELSMVPPTRESPSLNTVPEIQLGIPEMPSNSTPTPTGRVFPLIDPMLLNNYNELLNETRLTAMKNLLPSYLSAKKSGTASPLADVLTLLYQGVHEFKGMARFIRAHVTEEAVNALEQTLLACQQNIPDENGLEGLITLSNESLDYIYGLKKSLCDTYSEESYWNQTRDTLNNLLSKHVSFRTTLGSQIKNAA